MKRHKLAHSAIGRFREKTTQMLRDVGMYNIIMLYFLQRRYSGVASVDNWRANIYLLVRTDLKKQ